MRAQVRAGVEIFVPVRVWGCLFRIRECVVQFGLEPRTLRLTRLQLSLEAVNFSTGSFLNLAELFLKVGQLSDQFVILFLSLCFLGFG